MAKVGTLGQLFGGDNAQNSVINQNADRLDHALDELAELREVVKRQASEIVQLRAMFTGVVSLLHENGTFSEADLDRSVKAALAELSPPPASPQKGGDPYRGIPHDGDEPSASDSDIEAAKGLLVHAQDHHFSKRFDEARAIYQQIVETYGHTKQAATARQQLENLRRA